MDVANAIASSPLKSAGYTYINLDCGYSTGFRSADGSLTVNTTRYPHGMVWLGNQIHALGLKFGMYSDAGTQQCCSRVYGAGVNDGSFGREEQDAATFASWGVDYLKHDSCGNRASSYPAMRDALNKTGRRILYSIHGPTGVPDIANCWRTTGDITNTWESILSKVMLNDKLAGKAAPGAFNDPDMLEVGNLFNPLGDAEGRSHFSMWAVMKAPLLIGTDPTNMTDATLSTLTNEEAIAINQDSLGKQARLQSTLGSKLVFVGELADGHFTALIVNTGNETQSLSFDMHLIGATVGQDDGEIELPLASFGGKFAVRDLWKHKDLGNYGTTEVLNFTDVGPHDCVLLRMQPV